MGARVFTDRQLRDVATPRSLLIERAIADLDRDALRVLSADVDTELLSVHDPMEDYLGSLQTRILRLCGRREHDEAVRWAADLALRPGIQRRVDESFPDRVRQLGVLLRASGSTFTVEEDPLRVTFVCDPFGPLRHWRSPQPWQSQARRKVEARATWYPAHDRYASDGGFAVLEEASPLTGGQAGMPCALVFQWLHLMILPMQEWGEPWAVIDGPVRRDGQVRLVMYKDPADVPSSAYANCGMTKPPVRPRPVFTGEALTGLARELVTVARSRLVAEAAETGDMRLAAVAAESIDDELVAHEGPQSMLVTALLTWIARHLGEAASVAAMEEPGRMGMTPYIRAWSEMDDRARIQQLGVFWRAHGSTFWIEEEEDRFILHGRPLGACHRLLSSPYQQRLERVGPDRLRYPTFGAYGPPNSLHRFRQPLAITCGRSGYPIYSARCHLLHEVMPIETIGSPLWAEVHPIDDPDGTCYHLVQKAGHRWPDWVYRRLEG